ncbi:MAG: hypothetical protein ABJH68_01855 [Ilumatobacter sp.]|uniref:hypothetical protein n=1 Tax=Ilumatobacter sp. TaxID=1967498 RepID=UPI003299240F
MEPFPVEGISPDKRTQIERWWERCTEPNLDESEYAFFLDAATTPDEIAAFLSPFDHADLLVARVMETQPSAITPEPPDEETLVAALRELVAEMAQNALVVGEPDMAALASSVPEYRLVDQIERPPGEQWLGADIDQEISAAVRRQLRQSGDVAAQNLNRIVKAWLPELWMAAHVMQPLTTLDLHLDATRTLFSLGGESKVTSDVALVARLASP